MEIWRAAGSTGSLAQRNAVCVSTIDANGYPSSRFVDLKEAGETGFVFCTHLDSAKARDIERDPRAAMTMWWEHVAMQIRITGLCERITDREADAHWTSRSRDAQIVSAAFRQSHVSSHADSLAEQYARAVIEYEGGPVPRPVNWGGFRLRPEYIEFLEFKENRLHVRTAYTLVAGQWHEGYLQP